jgi:hypothetical protein
MKTLLRGLWLLLVTTLSMTCTVSAQSPRPTRVHTGKMSTVHLLAIARVSQPSPDGVRFLVMVTPAAGIQGQFALKETRDFLIDGKSYREMTKAETGRVWEPSTELDTADGFFAKQPGARRLAPENIAGAKILVVAIGGAALPPQGTGEVTFNLGLDKEVEPFTFAFSVPPGAPARPQSAGPPAAMSGPPRMPGEGVTRYQATDGVGFAPWTFDLKMTGRTVSGAVYQHREDGNGVSTNAVGPFEIFDGQIEGGKLTFKARDASGERVVTFTGETSGDDIRFTRKLDLKPGTSPGRNGILGATGATEFVARKVTP